MTLETTTRSVTYLGNGSTSIFPFSFLIPEGALRVEIVTNATGLVTPISPGAYVVDGLGDPAGGFVTYTLSGSPLQSGFSIRIIREVDYVQETSLLNQSRFYPEVVEAAFDYLTMQTQQNAEEISRSIRGPIGTPLVAIPKITPNAAIVVNEAGDGFESGPLATDIADAQEAAESALASAERAEAAENLVTRLYPRRGTFVADGTTGSFVLEGEYDDPSLISLYIDGLLQSTTTDYTVTTGSGDTTVTLVEGGSPVNFPKGAVVHWIASFQIGAPVAAAEGTSQYDRVFVSRAAAQATVFPEGMNVWAVLDPPPPHVSTQKLLYARAPASTDNPAIVSANGVKGVPAQAVTPEHFGYSPEGELTARSAAFNNAIAYIKEQGGGVLNLGPRTYRTGGNHRIDFDNFSLVGAGKNVTTFETGTTGPMFHFEGTDAFNQIDADNIFVRDIRFQGVPDVYNTGSRALRFVGTRNNVVENCTFDGTEIAIVLEGTQQPTHIRDNYFEHARGRNVEYNWGGGSFLHVLPLEVAKTHKNGKKYDPDFAYDEETDLGTYFASCTSVWVNGNQLRHFPSTVENGIVVRGCDGLDIHDNHILTCTGSQILFDQQYSTAVMWNLKVYNNHFDGTKPLTDNNIKIADAAYATSTFADQGMVTCARIDIYNNNFDDAGGNQLEQSETWEPADGYDYGSAIYCGNRDIAHLSIKDNFFRSGTTATDWIEIQRGGGVFNFTGNKVLTRNGGQPAAALLINSQGPAQYFNTTIIADNSFISTETFVADDWVKLVGGVNTVVLANNVYQDASAGSGNAFLDDQSTSGTVIGDEITGGNISLSNTTPKFVSDTFTPAVRFATPGDAAFTNTTYAGEYQRFGKFATIHLEVKFDLTHTTAAGTFLIDLPGLPFDLDATKSTMNALNVEFNNIDLLAAHKQVTARVNTADTLRLQLGQDTAASAIASVTEFPTGTSNIRLIISGSVLVTD